MESGNQDKQMKLLDVVGLQMLTHTIGEDLLGRYVSNPANLGRIYDLVDQLLAGLRELPNKYDPARCPGDWMHYRCRCVPPPAHRPEMG